MEPAGPKCVLCGSHQCVKKISDRLVLAASAEQIRAKLADSTLSLKWVAATPEHSHREKENRALLNALVRCKRIEYANAWIRLRTAGHPRQVSFFTALERRYPPELCDSEVRYAGAVCDKFWKLEIGIHLYEDALKWKKGRTSPLANFALFGFVVGAHGLLDNVACWLREAAHLQDVPLKRTGIFRKHKKFRARLGQNNGAVWNVIRRNEAWLEELNSRRDTMLHRSAPPLVSDPSVGVLYLPTRPDEEFFGAGPTGTDAGQYMASVVGSVEEFVSEIVKQA